MYAFRKVSRLHASDAEVLVFVLQEEVKRIAREDRRKMNDFMNDVSDFFECYE
jgi:hypothetical protein